MKHTKPVSMLMAIVMLMGVLTVPASAAEVDKPTYDEIWAELVNFIEQDDRVPVSVLTDGVGNVVMANYINDILARWGTDYKEQTAKQCAANVFFLTFYYTPYMAPVDATPPDMPVTTSEPTVTPIETETMPEPTETKTVTFTDVDDDAWYATAVYALAEGGLMNGIGNNQFNPDGNITYAEMAAVMFRIYSNLETIDKDTDTHWAQGMFNRLTWTGVDLVYTSNWTNIEELLDTSVAREFAISSLYSITDYMPEHAVRCNDPSRMKVWGRDGRTGEFIEYPDDWYYEMGGYLTVGNEYGYFVHKQMSEKVWTPYDIPDLLECECYWPEVLKAYNAGIVSGIDAAGNCNPNGLVTRAEFAQMLYNMGITTAGQIERTYYHN